MTILFSLLSILIYCLGVYAEGIIYLLPTHTSFDGFILFEIITCLLAIIYYIKDLPDDIVSKTLLILSVLINTLEIIGYCSIWIFRNYIIASDISLLSRILVLGPIALLVLGILLVITDDMSSYSKDELEEINREYVVLNITRFFFSVCLLILSSVIYFSNQESLEMKNEYQSIILSVFGYESNLNYMYNQILPTWFNFAEWTLRLKLLGVITIIILAFMFLILLSIINYYGNFIRRLMCFIIWVIESFYFIQAFLVFRKLVLLKIWLWRLIELGIEVSIGIIMIMIVLAVAWGVYHLGEKVCGF